MKIGLITEKVTMQSMKHVYRDLERVLSERHEVVNLPPEYFYLSPERQVEMLEALIPCCDAMIGKLDDRVLQTRERIGKHVPMIGLLLGVMSRGAIEFTTLARYLTSTDILVGNCAGDVEIARKFFKNAQIQSMPFSYDESTFYVPTEVERQKIKADMGFRKDDRILLYAGRVTIEKNLQSILKVFSVLQGITPDLHLVIAGEPFNNPFGEFGVYAVNIAATIVKLINELKLSTERVHFLGHKNPTQLRDIYAIADIFVNLTLHHDENFGYAQVEAMACGTPVIGTRWGGLKDSIKHGETGYQISTVVTDSGVKLNWWEAINRIAFLLANEEALRRFRERCSIHVRKNFSRARYAEALESILDAYRGKVNVSKGEPLSVTPFADQFWLHCKPRSVSPPPYQRGQRAFELYKELITPFTGVTESLIRAEEAISPQQLLVLAAPVRIEKEIIKIDDPIFPFTLVAPDVHREALEATLGIMKKEPIIKVERLENMTSAHRQNSLHNALRWMFDSGILLRAREMDTGVTPGMIGERMSKPLFSIQSVDYLTDVLVVK